MERYKIIKKSFMGKDSYWILNTVNNTIVDHVCSFMNAMDVIQNRIETDFITA